MKRVGITGGIAEGKSTVLRYLAELGYETASADDMVRALHSEPSVQESISALVGADGPVSKEDLREAMTDRPHLRRELNRLLHPRILAAIQESPAAFVEAPLLVEACIQGHFDEVWVVTCGRDEQFRRLEARVGRAEAVKLMGVQLPTDAKEPFADVVIRTNRPEEIVFQEVRAFARRASGR